MLNIFRRIRRNLANQNKFVQYSRYAIGEIILVVIGILFALQINNWNIKNVQQMEGRTYLTSIKSNLVQDTLVLRLTIENIKLTLKTLDSTAGLISMNESILLKGSGITNAMLVNDSVTLGTTEVDLGTTAGTLARRWRTQRRDPERRANGLVLFHQLKPQGVLRVGDGGCKRAKIDAACRDRDGFEHLA